MTRERIGGSDTPPSYQSRFVEVALPLPVRRLFTYRVPEGLAGCADAGCRAVVPFGKRSLTGVVTGVTQSPPIEPARIRDVAALPDAAPSIRGPLLEVLLWASRYYVAPPGPMLAGALPPSGRRRGHGPARGGLEPFFGVAVEPASALAACPRAPRQRQVIEVLASSEGMLSGSDLRARLGEIGAQLAALRKKGILRLEMRRVERPVEILEFPEAPSPPVLTADQRGAVAAVAAAVEAGIYRGFLLLGPTGSGKTEVYLSAIEAALRSGRDAVYLVPEISLTPLLARTLKARFGGAFALIHSSLTPAQRRSEWERARAGSARVVLGPRSALWAPLEKVGLLVVDEEQDPSFKQEGDPRYNARDTALVRAQREGATALLGSATPSLESYRLTETGKLALLTLSERIEARPMAAVEVVDMREEEEATGGEEPVSRVLREALRESLDRREQAIVLLNRRGWAPAVLCRKCGGNVMCRRCTIALTWHRADRRLLCHYCGYQRAMPPACPSCGSERLVLAGAGTERLAEDLAALFPQGRFGRLDRDVARGRGEPGRILASFERGDCDVLVGTQLVAKGHDFPNVTLVGVVSADFTLGFPDFRAAERTFQILTQVAGRAGRGERPGRVIVQAYRPDHYAIQSAVQQDFEAFYRRESRYRRIMAYPPFSAMACLIATAGRIETARRRAQAAADAIRDAGGREVRVMGPAIAPLARLKGEYRFQILVRSTVRRRLSEALNAALHDLDRRSAGSRGLVVDVDPASLL